MVFCHQQPMRIWILVCQVSCFRCFVGEKRQHGCQRIVSRDSVIRGLLATASSGRRRCSNGTWWRRRRRRGQCQIAEENRCCVESKFNGLFQVCSKRVHGWFWACREIQLEFHGRSFQPPRSRRRKKGKRAVGRPNPLQSMGRDSESACMIQFEVPCFLFWKKGNDKVLCFGLWTLLCC